MTLEIIAAATLAIWLYLLLARGGFWRAGERDDADLPALPATWPSVVAVIPARDEAANVGETIGSLVRQDYPGSFAIVLVDDDSRDGTAQAAREAAQAAQADDRLTVLRGQPLPKGWTGKLWAMKQGIEAATGRAQPPDYLLLTDADILYSPDALKRLVARAQAGDFALTSLMVKLRCDSLAERALVPAFVFFFALLYPFSWVNRGDRATAAAAGGCMLVRPAALRQTGGIETIRGALIDDCALAQALKRHGPIWMGLTQNVRSIRPYPRLGDIRRMVSRSAYAQLRYSPLLLAGTLAGLALTYLAAPLLALFASGVPQAIGALVWLLMALSFQPVLRFYRRSPLWGLALPAIALLYMAFTLDSAYQHVRGRGGSWKGRIQANVSELR
ncbi:MAG: glycosyltransferase [Pseudomonadota bacterium]|nr:glycosyltransferase [Pseudomonadota bacterium]